MLFSLSRRTFSRHLLSWHRPLSMSAVRSSSALLMRPSFAMRRAMSSTTAGSTTGQELQKRIARRGPITWSSLALFAVTGAGLVAYFRYERAKIESQVPVVETKVYGKPKLGGPFELVDQSGKTITDKDLQGRFILIYFGFTYCPDICPIELGKMGKITESILNSEAGDVITPVFISVDPKRDTVKEVRDYVKEFSPNMVGLTGTPAQIAVAARAFRVYFSVAPGDDEDDYLVDHSIFFYLMDPQGEFVDYFAQNKPVSESAASIKNYIDEYKAAHPDWKPAPNPIMAINERIKQEEAAQPTPPQQQQKTTKVDAPKEPVRPRMM